MRICFSSLFLVLIMVFSVRVTKAQCTVTASASDIDIFCGDTISLSAIGEGIEVFTEDFNSGSPVGWESTASGVVGQFCGVPSPDNSDYLWFGGASPSPRFAVTPNLDLSPGGSICFFMRYSNREGGPDCEDPDAPDEGVHLQYSVNNGPWIEMQYWNPNGGGDPQLVAWNQYCVNIPAGAQQNNVRIRWVQLANTGDALTGHLDHWGIDDVEIIVNNTNANYTWQHTGITQPTGQTPDVHPTATTTYTVVYDDGVNTCSDNVTVNVRKPSVNVIADKTDICPGESVQLDAITDLVSEKPIACGINNDLGCVPIADESGEVQIGNGNIVADYNNFNADIFGDFGEAHNRTQIIYRANEIRNGGFTGGKIKGIAFEVGALENGRSRFLQNMIISIGCTNQNAFGNWVGGLNEIYFRKSYTVKLGYNYIPLDRAFDWDGQSNIVVQVCIFVPDGESSNTANWGNFTRDHNPGFAAVRQASTNFSDFGGVGCNLTRSEENQNNRPNTRFEFCQPNKNIDLSYLWSPNDGSLSSNNIKNPIATPNNPGNITYEVTMVQNGADPACAVKDQITINVQDAPDTPQPTYNVGLCEGDNLNLNFGPTALPPGASYNWTGPGGFNATDKNPVRVNATPAMNGTYNVVVSSSAGCPSVQGTVDVTVNPAPPIPVLSSNAPLCDGEELQLNASVANMIYDWTGPNGFSSSVQNPTRNDPAPQMDGLYSLVLEDPNTGCKSLNPTNITVVQRSLPPAPILNANKLDFCVGEDLELSTNVPGGFLDPNFTFNFFHLQSGWTDVQNGKGAIVANRNGLTLADAGMYALTIQENGSPCPSDTAFIEITVFDPGSFVASNTGPYCEGDLIELSVGDAGVGATYTWVGPNAFNATIREPNRPNATLADAGVYTVTIDNGLCDEPFSVSTTVNIVDIPDPGEDANTVVCRGSGAVDLFPLLGGTPDAGGTWTDDDNSGTLAGSMFNPTTVGTFNFTYRIAASGSCPEVSATLSVTVEPEPNAGIDASQLVCNTGGVINLFQILGGSPDNGGTWANVDAAPGFNPAGTFNPFVATAGVYRFEYTVSGSGICNPESSLVTITVEEKANPGTFNGNGRICEGDNIDLFTLISGNDPGGTWFDDNNSGGLSGSVFTAPSNGVFRFTYTVGNGGACSPSSVLVRVDVDRLPNAGTDQEISICEASNPINLFNQLNGNPDAGGTWNNLDASPGFIAPDSFDPDGLGGYAYTFEYFLPANGACPAQRAEVEVNVLTIPNTGTAVDQSICFGTTLDLFDALTSNDPGGQWLDNDNSNALESGSLFNTALLDEAQLPQTYRFTYRIAAQGCSAQSTTVVILVNKVANPGEDNSVRFCTVFGNANLTDFLNGNPDQGGTWTENGATNTLNGSSINTFTMSAGVYNYTYTVVSDAPCPDQSANLEVEILEQPSAGADGNGSVCSNATIDLSSLLQGADAGGNWEEITNSGGVLNPVTGIFQADNVEQGFYRFRYTIAASNGCNESTSEVEIEVLEAPSIRNLQSICSADRLTYTVVFEILFGNSANYSVDQPGVINGNVFTSDPIPSDQAVTFSVSDGGSCGGGSATVQKSCACVTRAQTMRQDTIIICEDIAASAQVSGTFVDDGDDVQKFYLHKGSGTVLEERIDSSDSPTFTFNPAKMFYDSIYYISAAAGDNLLGFPDESDDCYQLSEGTPIVFHEPTVLSSGVDKNVICRGESVVLSLTINGGKAPFTINYTEGNDNYSILVFGADTSLTFIPNTTTNIVIENIENANACVYLINDVFTIDVNQAPSARLSQFGNQCANENPSFFIEVDGDGNQFSVVLDKGVYGTETINNINKPGITYTPDLLNEEQVVSYSLLSVDDNSNSICPGTTNGFYEVYPAPRANIADGSLAICEGQSAQIPISLFGIGPFDITYSDGNGQTYNITLSRGDDTFTIPNGLSAGLYEFTVASVLDQSFGCINTGGSGQFTLTVNPAPAVQIELLDNNGNPLASGAQICEDYGQVDYRITHMIGDASRVDVEYNINGNTLTTELDKGSSKILNFNPIVGNNTLTIDAVRDLDAAQCLGTGNMVQLQVNPLPTATLAAPNPLFCEGSDVIIQVAGTGEFPLSAELLDDQGNVLRTLTVTSPSGSNVNLGPFAPGQHQLFVGQISDASPNTCFNQGNASISIAVQALPTANFDKAQYTVCDGETVDIRLLTNGTGNVQTIISTNGNSSSEASLAGVSEHQITLPAGLYTFQIDSIIDQGSINCVAKPIDQTQLLVQALPTANMAWSQNPVCENLPVSLLVTASGNGPFTFDFSDNLGNNYQEVLNQGSNSFTFLADQDKRFFAGQISDNTVNEQGQACSNNLTQTLDLDVLERPIASIFGEENMCQGEQVSIGFNFNGVGPFTVEFEDSISGQVFTEVFNQGTNVYNVAPNDTAVYKIVRVTDSQNPTCDSTGLGRAVVDVISLPQVDFDAIRRDSCGPFLARFSPDIQSDYALQTCTWDLGNGTMLADCNGIENVYLNPGSYSVSLEVEHQEGCRAKRFKSQYISIHPDPEAAFDYSPETPTTLNSLLQLYNQSLGANRFNWYLDSTLITSRYAPQIPLPNVSDTSLTLCLEAISTFDCRQTVCEDIFVNSVELVYVPNAFTPDGDGINDTFLPSVVDIAPESYHLMIFNRWGELVFESFDQKQGWDGMYRGEKAQMGLYNVRLKVAPKNRLTAVKVYDSKVSLLR